MAEAGLGRKKRKLGDRTTAKWPSVKPKRSLQITQLKDYDLFTVQNFFSSAESKAFIKIAESIGFEHQGSLGPTKGEAYRDNDRISVNDPTLADAIWQSRLSRLFSDIKIRGKVAVGLNPNIRFYRYKVGQCFGRHIDASVDLGEGKRTHYTLLIYLSGGLKTKGKSDSSNLKDSASEPLVGGENLKDSASEPLVGGENLKDSASEPLVGGETVFYDSWNDIVAEVAPTEGTALLHIHGDKCMLHEAQNVSKGIKYVFRSDVVFARGQ